MWDISDQALDFRVVILVLTTCLTSLGRQSLANGVRRAFRTTDQFAKHFYHDLDGESKFEDVQATVRWKQRIMITLLTTSAGAISLSRAIIVSTATGRSVSVSQAVLASAGEEWLHCGILVSIASENFAFSFFFRFNSLAFTDWFSFYCSSKVSPCNWSRAVLSVIPWASNWVLVLY
jgi:hypothetical protein